MNLDPSRYYKESGKVNSNSVIGVILIVLTITLGIGWIYGFLSYYYPFPVYSVLLVIGYAAIVGYSMYLSVRLFKIRNQKFVSRLSLVLGFAAFYIAWIWFMTVEQGYFVWNPVTIVQAITIKVEWWGVYIFWVLEAGLIMFVMWFSVTSEVVEPFCEPCSKWIKPTLEVSNLEPINQQLLIEGLKRNNFDYLMHLRKINDTAHKQSRVKLYSCNFCGEENYLTIEQVFVVIQKNKKPKEDYCLNIEGNLKVNRREMDTLLKWGENCSIVQKNET
jgi:hypothetical protein